MAATQWNVEMTSSSALRDRIDRALGTSGYLPLRNIRVIAEEGRVSLVGRVPTYHMKQIAQATVLSVDGIDAVENDLIVC
jgi:osmotically-inducible protein OsmY